MANLTQAIATYSFVDRPPINLGTVDPSDTSVALLARIDALMSSAAASFNARQYDDAISEYHAIESLIYAHLDPEWVPNWAASSGLFCREIRCCSTRYSQPRLNG